MSTYTEDRKVGTEEPINTEDVAEGGILGALGGGIIGALAGGPVGAVIGAVLGGGASAVAVDIVDHHDHDSTAATTTTPESTFFSDNFKPNTSHDEVEVVPVIVVDRTYVIEQTPTISAFSGEADEQTIRNLAYELWEQRGHAIGFAERDWLDAEDELTGATAVAA